jgi:hypothetical protein
MLGFLHWRTFLIMLFLLPIEIIIILTYYKKIRLQIVKTYLFIKKKKKKLN